jgi:hypothetical protein
VKDTELKKNKLATQHSNSFTDGIELQKIVATIFTCCGDETKTVAERGN